MKTLEFTGALREIVKKLMIDELLSTLDLWLAPQNNNNLSDGDKDAFHGLLFDSRSGFNRLMEKEASAKILHGLGVPAFYDPGRLRRLLATVNGVQNLAQVKPSVELNSYREMLRSFRNLVSTCESLLEKEKIGTTEPSQGIFQLELADYDGKGIEPQRLVLLATTVRELHANLARLFGIESDSLRFTYFDSGSALLLGVQCSKEIAKTISDLLLQWWDKIKFSEFETLDKKMDAVERAAAMAEKMNAAIKAGVVDELTGKNLTHRIFQEVDTLIGIGATPPLEAEVRVDQRALILAKRDVKLLESGQQTDQGKSNES